MIDVDDSEENSIKLTQSKKVLNYIYASRKAHNGPITTIEELDSLFQNKKIYDKALHKSLNLEIRLCTLTLTNRWGTVGFWRISHKKGTNSFLLVLFNRKKMSQSRKSTFPMFLVIQSLPH